MFEWGGDNVFISAMNGAVIGLFFDVEVFMSNFATNDTFDLGSQMVLSDVILDSMNLTGSSVSYDSTNFTSYFFNDTSWYNGTVFLSSYVNITNSSASYDILDQVTASLTNISCIQQLFTEEITENHQDCQVGSIYFASNVVNTTITAVNITNYLFEYMNDDKNDDNYYYGINSTMTTASSHHHSKGVNSLVIVFGVLVAILAIVILILIIFTFFPSLVVNCIPKFCRNKYRVISTNFDFPHGPSLPLMTLHSTTQTTPATPTTNPDNILYV